MEIAMPEFPAELKGQLIYAAALVAVLIGLIMVVLPRAYARLFGIIERQGRNGAIGEIRAIGGFMAGLALATFLFQDQPELPLALGVALLMATFGRILALMGDHAASLSNVCMLLIQAGLAGCLMSPLFEVWTPESVLAIPEDPGAWLAFVAGAIVAALGVILMFAPRLAMMAPGLSSTDVSETALGPARSCGGFAVGVGAMVMASGSIMLLLAFGFALVASGIGRLVAMAVERGNWVFNILALLATAILAFLPLNYVLGMM